MRGLAFWLWMVGGIALVDVAAGSALLLGVALVVWVGGLLVVYSWAHPGAKRP